MELVQKTSVADLLAFFNNQSTSDYLVVYLRWLNSGYLQWVGRLSRSSASRKWKPLYKESTTSTLSLCPKPSASPEAPPSPLCSAPGVT